MIRHYKSTLLIATALAGLSLSGCGTTSSNTAATSKSATTTSQAVDNALMRAADQTTAYGMNAEGLKILETVYRRNPSDPQAAMRYARGLREMDEMAKAAIVLKPFAEDVNSLAELKLEYSAIQLEAGRYDLAENIARNAVNQDPSSGYGYHLLGTALDAQGLHEQSEVAFRSALEKWSGDPVPVMNNLALSLMAQEKLEEAANILQQAKAADPTRLEIERNLRIVNALREVSPYAPTGGRADDASSSLQIRAD